MIASTAPCPGQERLDAGPLRLRPGDSVRLLVRDEPGLKGDFVVDDGGQALLPLLGMVTVAGRDFAEVRREVATRFARELERGEVQLTPLLRIAVLGEVRQPALYPVDPTYTIMDVIALAGGLATSADPRRVFLVREGRTVDLDMRAGAAPLDAPLRSGDQVVVGRRSWLRENTTALVTTGASIAVAMLTAVILR